MDFEYELFLESSVHSELINLPKRKRRVIVAILDRLAFNPFFEVDHSFTDEKGRSVYQSIIDDILVTFSVDHAIREVKIHEVILLCE